MNKPKIEIKLAYVQGLQEVVLSEIGQYPILKITQKEGEFIYLDCPEGFAALKKLKSVQKVFIVSRDSKYHPHYVSKHKSLLGKLVTMIISPDEDKFKTFKLICAGSDSQEVRSIGEYVNTTYGLKEEENADLKIHIIKSEDVWEVGAQMTPRPLSVRNYKVRNMEGAMDPTIAFAVNSLCNLEKVVSYLNIFSGSATLLIEAGLLHPNLKQLIGFDNDKGALSLAIQNIRKAGLIRKIKLKEKDIFENPNLGKFDVITSDLPFGQLISKYDDLEDLYKSFINYSQKTLNPNGTLVVYTSQYRLIRKMISKSKFKIVKKLDLTFTSTKAKLYPKILVCKLKSKLLQ